MIRNELITMINNLCDENINLKVRNEYLEYKENEKNNMCELKEEPSKGISKLERYGKEKLYDELVRYDTSVSAVRDDEGNIKTKNIKSWIDGVIYTYNVPNYMSKEEAINYIYDKLEEEYYKEKEKAIKKLEIKEAKEGEENE